MVFGVSMKLVQRPNNIQGNIPQEIFNEEYSRAISEAIVLLRGKLAERSPVGGTAGLTNSWVTDGPNVGNAKVSGEVSSPVDHAIVIDQGAKPHTPPSGDDSGLNQWVRRKLRLSGTRASTAAFLISRSIKRRGLPKRRIFTDEFEDLENEFDEAMARAEKRSIERLEE